MSVLRTWRIRRWLTWVMLVVLVLSLIGWFLTPENLPREIRIATGRKDGLYYKFGEALQTSWQQRTGRRIEVDDTSGSVENFNRLVKGEPEKAELAILQNGSVELKGLAIVAPLYPDVVHVIVRKNRGINGLADLQGKAVLLGPHGSGNRENALKILGHYLCAKDVTQIERAQEDAEIGAKEDIENFFIQRLVRDTKLDAALVITGMYNPSLRDLLSGGQFELLPILEAEALAVHHPYFVPFTIPRGLYNGSPLLPQTPIPTLATTALLTVRAGASNRLVTETLGALYESDLHKEIPTLFALKAAREFSGVPLHPAARQYFDPNAEIAALSSLLEFLANTKELLVALGAALYLLWDRWRRLKEKESQEAMQVHKERLDRFLQQTMAIERAQMETEDPGRLREYLREVTRIKLQALEELTDEALRGDRLFSIFLAQCATLTQKIQGRIMFHSR